MNYCFPDPYPDELFYSICARFSDHVRYSSYTTVLSLFGYKGRLAITDLPGHLNHFINNLVQKDYYTVDNLINNHTLLPFYSLFLSDLELKQIRSEMTGDKNHVIYPSRRYLKCGVLPQEWLRFCSLCVAEDRKKFGECYWHRAHQIPGVDVCIEHYTYLQNSNISRRATKPNYKFFSAEENIQIQPPIELNPSNSFEKILLQIAGNALWLMCQQKLSNHYFSCWQYNQAIFDQGWYLDDNIICTFDRSRVLKEFENRYNETTLSYFRAAFDEHHGKTWPIKFVWEANHYHPVHHLLFIHFLGYKIEDFCTYFFKPAIDEFVSS